MIDFSYCYNVPENPVDPRIPDGVYTGQWHSSGTYVDEYPDIDLHPKYASRSMFVDRATIWIFKPFALIIEGEGRPLTFPITLKFNSDLELVSVDGDTEFVEVLPKNLVDYLQMDKQSRKKFFNIEVELPF